MSSIISIHFIKCSCNIFRIAGYSYRRLQWYYMQIMYQTRTSSILKFNIQTTVCRLTFISLISYVLLPYLHRNKTGIMAQLISLYNSLSHDAQLMMLTIHRPTYDKRTFRDNILPIFFLQNIKRVLLVLEVLPTIFLQYIVSFNVEENINQPSLLSNEASTNKTRDLKC